VVDWGDLIPEVTPYLETDAVAGATEFLTDRGIVEDSDIWTKVLDQARQMARERGAELVGKRITDKGEIVDNPDARYAITETTRENLRELISKSVDEGWTTTELQHNILQSEDFSAARALTISRTESMYAYNHGKHEAAKGTGQKFKQQIGSGDACEECMGNIEAGLIPIDEDFPSGIDCTPNHPNCLLGDTEISPGFTITGVTSREYDGEIVVIGTESGKLISITPNHPVLTERGWVAAGILRKRDSIVGSRTQYAHRAAHANDEDVPTSIQEIVESFLGSRKVATVEVPTSSIDFHGDGTNGKIAIVGSNRGLTREFCATSLEHFGEDVLVDADGPFIAQGASVGSPNEFVLASLRSPNSVVGGGSDPATLLGRSPSHPGIHGGAHRPDRSSVRYENSMDDIAANGIALCQRLLAHSRGVLADNRISVGQYDSPESGRGADLDTVFQQDGSNRSDADSVTESEAVNSVPGEIFLDDIVSIERQHFVGHVYNLETKNGWYIGNSIVVHNCRCGMGYSESESEGEE
jgi:hypothetical protein